MLSQLIKNKFNADEFITFFNNIITFNKYVEVRIFDLQGKYNPMSRYAASVNDLIRIMKRYDSERWLLYYGINTRPSTSGKNADVVYRNIFYFDIEFDDKSGEKPPLADEDYQEKLGLTLDFIGTYLHKKYGIKPSALTISGRGVHLYYKHFPINNIENKHKFSTWFKNIQEEMDKIKPCKDIKFSDSVFDGSRIAALPGTYNHKYPEKPFKNLLWQEKNEFDLTPILDEVKVKEYKSKGHVVSDAYDNNTIRDSPEYQLLCNYANLPEGDRHNRLEFAFKLLCRDNQITNLDELHAELSENGFDGILEYPDEEYSYSTSILNNWCLNNFVWCVDNNYKLPYPFHKGWKVNFLKISRESDFPDLEINDFDALLSYIREFNRSEPYLSDGVLRINYDYLVNKLENNCSEKLWKFVKMNDLLNSIICLR